MTNKEYAKSTKEKFLNWTKTENHIYNKEVIKCDVYAKSFGHGIVYVMDKEDFTHTFSFGANSDYSFSGSFYTLPVHSIQDAMKALNKFALLYIADKKPKLKDCI